ncbi:MAG: aldolase, partial [Clostridia bacterium]|nr:aldolase [Clostridia bacterium]
TPEIAVIAEKSGVDYIFVDMEYIDKDLRQKGNTVKNHHEIEDVRNVRKAISGAKLLVRCNHIHDRTDEYCSTEEEINAIIDAGADEIMLPYFKTVEEVKRFLACVDGRVKTILLIETPEAVECVDEILALDGIDRVHVGINDLSIGYGKKFMFELLADGTVEKLCEKFKLKGIPYGFGGIASIGKGVIPAEMIIKEHYRLGSTGAILSRSFLNLQTQTDLEVIEKTFTEGVKKIRELEKDCMNSKFDYAQNHSEMKIAIEDILQYMP